MEHQGTKTIETERLILRSLLRMIFLRSFITGPVTKSNRIFKMVNAQKH